MARGPGWVRPTEGAPNTGRLRDHVDPALTPPRPRLVPTHRRHALAVWVQPVADAAALYSPWIWRGVSVRSHCGCCCSRSSWASVQVGARERRTSDGCFLLEFVRGFVFCFVFLNTFSPNRFFPCIIYIALEPPNFYLCFSSKFLFCSFLFLGDFSTRR